MPYRIDTLGGRVIVLGSILAGLTVFGLWFTDTGPFSGAPTPRTTPRRAGTDPVVHPGEAPDGPPARYPSLESDPAPRPGPEHVVAPDFDPLERPGSGPSTSRSLWELLRLLPEGTSVLGMVRVKALRRHAWADDLLSGRKLPHLHRTLEPLGLNLRGTSRVVFGVELEARPGPAPAEGSDHRFLGRLDRPFVLVVEGQHDRKALLQRYRRVGPLAATEMAGRRIYRRAGDYAMTFPVEGVVAWTYRRPMGPVLQTMLEDASRTALGPAVRRVLQESGLRRPPPRAGATGSPRPMGVAPRTAPSPRRRGAKPGATGPARQPAPEARPRPPATRPRRTGPPPRAVTPEALDRALPWITLLWTPQPGQRIPYPLNRLGGYGAKTALRGAVLTLGPAPQGGGVRLELRLLYQDAQTPGHMASLLRYARRHVSQMPRVRRANLGDLVDGVPVQVRASQIVVTVELRPWHIRALLLLFHKLLETGT